MTTSYIQLKSSIDAGYLKLKVFHQGPFGGVVQPREIHRTLTGKITKSIGVSYRVWNGVAKIAYSAVTGDVTLAKMQEWMTGDTIAKQQLTLIDHFGTTYSVMMINDYMPEAISPVPDGVNSYYLVPIEMEQQ